ncbi:MAG TPA: SusC/RagA family TonB-linked outer membrane protein, partial [Flavobacterium sp.]|nr:SusC/RagA family TonB-linked outer membrane protein [Flavobacterium sp.]
KKKLNVFLALFMVLTVQIAFAQERTVSGTVSDQNGLPLPGVGVTIKGTTSGTQTDLDGKFQITASPSQVLVFSFIGLKTQEIAASSTNLSVRMADDATNLETVVVTGAMGIKRRRDEVTSSTQVVTNREITQAANPNVIRSLAGKVSGLQVNNSSNGVNSKTRIVLRGTRSLTGNNEALVVIDNAISSATALQQLPPEIIESFNIIKGAQGAALYGDQGVNGVIIVTTKRGTKNEKLVVSVNSSIDFEQISFLPKRQMKYGQGWDGEQLPDENGGWGALFNGELVETGLAQANGQPLLLPYSPIKDNFKPFFKTGFTSQNGVTLNAGGENGYVLFTANNIKTEFVVKGDEIERNSFILKAGRTIGKFKIDGNVNYNYSKSTQTSAENNRDGILNSLLQGASNIPVEAFENSGPGSGWTAYYKNPYWVRDNNRINANQTFLNGIVTLGYEINKNINVSYTGNVQFLNRESQSYINGYTDQNDHDSLSQTSEFFSTQSAQRNFYGDLLINFDYKLTDDLNLKFNLGNNIQDRSYRETSNGGTNLDIPGWYNIKNVLNPANPLTLNNRYTRSRRYAFFGNLDLGYKEFLFLNVTGRYDGTSVLSKDNQTYFYPSAGLSFIPLKAFKVESDAFNYAKVSASIVRVGNTGSIDPYDINDVRVVPTGFPFGSTGSYIINRFPTDPNIKPEFVTTKELDLSLGFFKDRLTFDGAIYRADVDDLITEGSTSSASGLEKYTSNVGALRTTGIELDLGITPIKTEDFTWNLRASYSSNKTVVKSLSEGADQINLFTANSDPGYNGFTVSNIGAGIFAQVGEEFPLIKGTTLVRDPNGNVIIGADGLPSVNPNFSILGRVTPDYILGFTNTLEYKGLRLVAVFDYRTGHKVISETKYNLTWTGHLEESAEFDRDQGFIYPGSVMETAPGSGIYVPNTTPSAAGYGGNGVISYYDVLSESGENNVIDATAFRCRELALSYSFPEKSLERTGLTSLRIGINARNPFIVLSSENKGYTDPEADNTYNAGVTNSAVRALGNTSLNGQGYSGTGQYPSTRTFGCSINLTF